VSLSYGFAGSRLDAEGVIGRASRCAPNGCARCENNSELIAWMAGMLSLHRLSIYHREMEIGSKRSETFIVLEIRC